MSPRPDRSLPRSRSSSALCGSGYHRVAALHRDDRRADAYTLHVRDEGCRRDLQGHRVVGLHVVETASIPGPGSHPSWRGAISKLAGDVSNAAAIRARVDGALATLDDESVCGW